MTLDLDLGMHRVAKPKHRTAGAAAGEPLYGHNEDWETNVHRCPMYLGHVEEIDETWEQEENMDEEVF